MSPAGTTPSSSSWKPARVRVKTRKRVHVNGIATSRKVARVEGRGRPSLKLISNSEEENASFEVDDGTGVPSPKSSSPATKPQQPIDSPLPSDRSKRKKRKTATRTNRHSPPERRLRKAKKEMPLRVRSKGAGKSRVETISKLFSSSDLNILVGGHGSNWELSKSARGKSISGSSKPQPLKFSDQQNVIAGGQRSNDRGGKSILGSSKPQPLENIWIDEASPKSSSPVTEPQQPLNDEEDLSYTNSHLTFEQIAENAKKLHERMMAESESESDDNGMQCNCDFNNCTCLKSYYEYLAHDFEELDFRAV